MTTEPHVVRDLGKKLADDIGAATFRTIALVPDDPWAQAQIVQLALYAILGQALPAQILCGLDAFAAKKAVIEDVIHILTMVTQRPDYAEVYAAMVRLTAERALRS